MSLHGPPDNRPEADPQEGRRTKVLKLFMLIFAGSLLPLGILFYQMKAALLFQACMGAAFLMCLNLVIFRQYKNLALSGNLSVSILWITLALIRWNGGSMAGEGLLLLSWIWNGVVILLAIFFTGYKWGSLWTCLVFFESGLSVYLYRTGHPFTNLIPFELAPLYALGSYLFGLLALFLFALLFERDRQEALLREERKSVALRESKKFIEDVLERLPVPTFVVDRQHRVVQWNKACRDLSGVAAGQVIGRRVWEGFYLDEEGSLADKILDNPDGLTGNFYDDKISISGSGSFALKGSLPHLKDLQAIMKTAPIVSLNGTVSGAIQTIQPAGNNTGLRSGDDSEESTVVSPFPSFNLDMMGRISAWNRASEGLFGYPAARVLGTSALSLVSKPHRQNFRNMVIRALQGESCAGEECECVADQGRRLFVLPGAKPLGSSSEIHGCSVVLADVTPLRSKLFTTAQSAASYREKLKKTLEEHQLLKKNIASFIREKHT